MASYYFQTVEPYIIGNPNLWEPQIMAYENIKNHFDSGETAPAVACLPTGTGKTGLMAIVPFGVANKRVLLIAPGRVIKRGLIKSLDPRRLDNFWYQRKVILSRAGLPVVVEFDSGTRGEVLEAAQFVVANIQMTQASNPNSLLQRVPRDFFDMVIIDEAHHSPAQSWVDVEAYFSAAKIVKVTGTPFRSDNEQIVGKLVADYPMGKAMARGYIKRLVNRKWLPEVVTFQMVGEDGVVRAVPYDDVLAMREPEWISRQVAFSPECNRLVVEKSLEILWKNRKATNNPHKIIAAAMSIRHAQEIRALYEEAGALATIVHSGLDEAVIEQNLTDFVNDHYQVIVSVGMLGEGFDHPFISIAAVFRPFRTRLPYAQFAGRALRSIRDGSVVDNTAHLVYHQALGLDALWEYYKAEEGRAQVIESVEEAIRRALDDDADDTEGEHARVSGPEPGVSVTQDGAVEAFAQSFLGGVDLVKAYEEALLQATERTDKIVDLLRQGGYDAPPEVVQAIQSTQEGTSLDEKRPDILYNDRRRRLKQTIEDGIAEILTKNGLDPKSPPTQHPFPTALRMDWLLRKAKRLDEYLVRLINWNLKQAFGRPREDLLSNDLALAQNKAEEYLAHLAALFGKEGH